MRWQYPSGKLVQINMKKNKWDSFQQQKGDKSPVNIILVIFIQTKSGCRMAGGWIKSRVNIEGYLKILSPSHTNKKLLQGKIGEKKWESSLSPPALPSPPHKLYHEEQGLTSKLKTDNYFALGGERCSIIHCCALSLLSGFWWERWQGADDHQRNPNDNLTSSVGRLSEYIPRGMSHRSLS